MLLHEREQLALAKFSQTDVLLLHEPSVHSSPHMVMELLFQTTCPLKPPQCTRGHALPTPDAQLAAGGGDEGGGVDVGVDVGFGVGAGVGLGVGRGVGFGVGLGVGLGVGRIAGLSLGVGDCAGRECARVGRTDDCMR